MAAPSSAVSSSRAANTVFTQRSIWNSELVRAKNDADVIAVWMAHGPQFNCVNISTALISFAKWDITPDGESCIVSMLKHYIKSETLIHVRDAAGTVASLAKMHFTGEEIAPIQKTLFGVIAQHVVRKSDFFDKPHPTSLVQILQSFDNQGQEIGPLLKAIEPQATQCLASFTKQQVVEIAVLYSKKGHKAESLFQEIQKQVLQNIRAYSPTQLSRIALACSFQNFGSEKFYKAIYSNIKGGIATLDAAGIECCLCVYGQSDENLALTKALEVVITSRKSNMSDQDFVSTLAACAKMQSGSDDFFRDMECEALNRLERFTPSSIALIASSFARVLGGSYSFFSSLEKKIVETIKQFEPQELVQIYHAYSTSRLADGKFLLKIERELESRGAQDAQDVVTMIWSMLLARSIEAKYLTILLDLLNQAFESGTLRATAQMLIEIETMLKADAPELLCKIKEPLSNAIERSKQEMQLLPMPERSSLQIDVEEALERCGYKITSQQFLDGVYVGILIPSEKLVIEVCDKSYYYRTSTNELTALSLIKKRILETKGYRMLHLPYFEWSWTNNLQEPYLRELIAREYKPIAELTQVQ